MRIARIECWREEVPLTRPYAIAYQSTDAVTILALAITTDEGAVGLGSATPVEAITGESVAACEAALSPAALDWIVGRDVRTLPRLLREHEELAADAPGARAAVDMALHDLFAKRLGLPLVEVLGRAHETLPTSVTIGIKGVQETLAEAEEHLGHGFRSIKVKIGAGLEADVERLARLKERVGARARLRADANQAYRPKELAELLRRTEPFELELLEQPMPPEEDESLRKLPEVARALIALDESVHDERNATELARAPRACGIFNIKLMKSGGIAGARRIAAVAESSGIELMWGCMDESVIGISAALHAALASPATRYLDLDGSFDLSRDLASGGFVLEEGCLRTTDRPGLGVTALPRASAGC